MSKAASGERRKQVLQYLQQHEGSTCPQIALGLNITTHNARAALRILIDGEAVETGEKVKVPAKHSSKKSGQFNHIFTYRTTGKPFNQQKVDEKYSLNHPEQEPGVRRILLLDKPCRRNQDGQGSGHHRVFIGSGRGWA